MNDMEKLFKKFVKHMGDDLPLYAQEKTPELINAVIEKVAKRVEKMTVEELARGGVRDLMIPCARIFGEKE